MSGATPTLIQKFRALPSGARTGIIGGAVVLGLFTVGTIFTEDGTDAKDVRPGISKDNLTVYNPGSTTATEAVAAELEASKKRVLQQDQKIALLEETTKQATEKNSGTDGNWSEISNLVAQVQSLQERVNSMNEKGGGGAAQRPEKSILDKLLPNVESNSTATNTTNTPVTNAVTTPAARSSPTVTIQVVGEDKKSTKVAFMKAQPTAYVPSGSNFEAVLLNGMDASTAIGANRTPTPALLRIKSDAILPNMFSFNVRECFVMAGGFGNMSSERVEMRTESMSCIDEGGQVWEGKIDGYLVGEDGKAGARGRVVSKQGALLAKSFMAGFVGGLGGAFAPQPVTALNLAGGTGGAPAYQYPNADQVIGNGMSTGLSNSSKALSQFYIKLAEQMFPIVELDAGRKMTIILLKGVELKMEKKGPLG
jgi:conjugal transfer pilus assembly protein TraB